MISLHEARLITAAWNTAAALDGQPNQFTPWETVEEALRAFSMWQIGIANGLRPADVTGYLLRHHEFCNRIPNALLLMLYEDEFDDEETRE